MLIYESSIQQVNTESVFADLLQMVTRLSIVLLFSLKVCTKVT